MSDKQTIEDYSKTYERLAPREGEDTLTSIVEELSCWPDGTTVPIHGLAERLRPLIGKEGLDLQQVAWTLDMDGRYWGEALSPELDDYKTGVLRRWLSRRRLYWRIRGWFSKPFPEATTTDE
jgi:hypothetical protein